jgi:hypothetical protein
MKFEGPFLFRLAIADIGEDEGIHVGHSRGLVFLASSTKAGARQRSRLHLLARLSDGQKPHSGRPH